MPILRSRLFAVAIATVTTMLFSPLGTADSSGLMVGGGAYYTLLDDKLRGEDLDDFEDIQAIIDDSSYGFNGAVGWRFNKWLAVDAGYWDLGEFESDRTPRGERAKLEATAFSLGGMLSVPLWILDVYARGGAAFWDADSRNFEDDGTDAYYGVGASLNLGGSLDIYLELIRFDLETDIDTAGLGLRFTF